MLKRIIKVFALGVAVLLTLVGILVIAAVLSPNGSLLLPVKHKQRFEHAEISRFPELLQTKGEQIVTTSGDVIMLRGVMPPDPARLNSRNMFERDFYLQIHNSGANVIRIAVHPERWQRDPDYLWRHLDPIVGWAGEMGMYVMIDWHFIGNIENGQGSEMPDIEGTPYDVTMDFWRQTAAYFRTAPNVIFDIWNEPAGGISADIWRDHATEIVSIIREQGAKQLVVVGGIEYSRDLSWVLENPVPDNNIAYGAHIYPAHTQSKWDDWFGSVSQKYPVLLSEWGFMDENRAEAPFYLIGTRATYGEPLLQYAEAHSIGWIACWYDDTWEPPMFEAGWERSTLYGQFVLEQLALQD